MKRVLASLLCATLIFSSGGFSTTVQAEEFASEQAVMAEIDDSAQETVLEVSPEASSEISRDEDVKENESGAEASEDEAAEGKEDAADAAADASSAETSEEEMAEDDATEASSTGASDEEVVEDDAAETSQDDAASTSSTEDAEEEEIVGEDAAAEGALDKKKASDEASELASGESKLLYTTLPESTATFYVDEDGVLRLKEGQTAPGTVVIPSEAKVIPAGIFDGEYARTKTIAFHEDNQLESIEAGAFRGNKQLTTVEIPAGVTEIKADTFKGCTALRSITVYGDVTSIGESAFQESGITSVDFKKVTTIAASAFYGCDKLKTANFPIVETIGTSAFRGCSLLSSDMYFADSITSIGTEAFADCGFTSIDLTYLSGDVNFGDGCFLGNKSLTSVKFPGGMEVIPQRMFYGCPKLEKINLGKDIKEIRNSAFQDCTAISSLVFPAATYKIGAMAFGGCTGITYIVVNHKSDILKVSIDDSAFPSKSGVVMKGFEVEVQDYAEKKGYKYESLNIKYKVKTALKPSKSATVKPSVTEAPAGTKVKVTVTPASGYVLENISITHDANVDVKLEETKANSQVFGFVMPDADVTIDVVMVEKSKAVKGSLTAIFKPVSGYSPSTDSATNTRVFDTSGRECQLVIRDDNGETNGWLWKYTSSNTAIATVTSTGIVRSVGKGTATITATLKSNTAKKVSVKVRVDGKATISNTVLSLPSKEEIENLRGRLTYETINGVEMPVITFEKHVTDNGAKSIPVTISAYEEDSPTSLIVKSNWKSTDAKIASVTATSASNKNTVTIKKGSFGETMITVSVLNKGQKTADEANTKSFIVRVLNPTPRLGNSNIVVDSKSTVGTGITVTTAYGYEIVGQDIELWTKNAKNKDVECADLMVYWNGEKEKFYIVSKHPAKPFKKTYTEATKLYLKGKVEKDSSTYDFSIPITKLTVENNELKPTITVTGKINMFYKGTAAEAGKVKVTQSLSALSISKVVLVSTANHKKAGSEATDSFARFFTTDIVNGKTIEITKSDANLNIGDKTKIDGYIDIYYEGYANPVRKEISIPVCDTAPVYSLSVKSATASIYRSNQEYELQLLNGKKEVISLGDLDPSWSSVGYVGLGLAPATTNGLFNAIDLPAIEEAMETDTITLKVNGVPKSGKAVIYVKKTSWSKELRYTFTLTANGDAPALQFDNATVTINKTYASQGATITAEKKNKNADGEVTGFYKGEVTYKAKEALVADYEALKKAMVISENDNCIVVNVPADPVANGTYTFSATPLVSYEGGTIPAAPVSFKVVVKETKPTFKLKSNVFKLNAHSSQIIGTEEYRIAYTIGNLPTGEEGTVETKDVQFVPVNAADPAFDEIAELEFIEGEAVARLKDTTEVNLNRGKTLKYTVKNLKISCGADEASIGDFKISLQLINKEPKVSVTTSGNINPVNRASKVTITANVANSVNDVESITMYEVNSANRPYQKMDEHGVIQFYSPHFKLEPDEEKGWKSARLVLNYDNPDESVKNGAKYKVVLTYKLAGSRSECSPVTITVTPKQVVPEIKTDKSSAVVYAGQAIENRTVKVKITSKNTKMELSPVAPTFVASTSAAIKKAFVVDSYDPETGVMNLKLVNPSAIVLNKTYTIKFATRYENQTGSVAGKQFTLKVTVRK